MKEKNTTKLEVENLNNEQLKSMIDGENKSVNTPIVIVEENKPVHAPIGIINENKPVNAAIGK
jgi:malonyl CoA-acyl carrier protein transacylase